MTRTILAASLVLVISVLARSSGAAIVAQGPAFPPPNGNVDFASSGSLAGNPGGFTWEYTNFDVTNLTGLWQGLDLAFPPSAGLDGTLSSLTYAGISGSTATWSGTTTWFHNITGVPQAADVRLQLTVIGSPGWVTLPILGVVIDPNLSALVDNTAGADYNLLQEFQADLGDGGGWVPLNSVLQADGNGGNTVSSYSLGFYSTPEPSGLALAACGFVGTALAYGRRRFRRRS